jgi:hypothetical protein
MEALGPPQNRPPTPTADPVQSQLETGTSAGRRLVRTGDGRQASLLAALNPSSQTHQQLRLGREMSEWLLAQVLRHGEAVAH